MGKQLGEPADRMAGDARQNITEPGEGLDPSTLANGDEAEQNRRRLADIVGAEKVQLPRPIGTARSALSLAQLSEA